MSNVSPATNQPASHLAASEDPGHTLGIVGLVLSIVASFVGLIISIVAFNQSKKAGFDNGLAKAGIVVGAITTVLSIAYLIVVFAYASSQLGNLPTH